jgi:predicted alpha/beta-fold hydrolase
MTTTGSLALDRNLTTGNRTLKRDWRGTLPVDRAASLAEVVAGHCWTVAPALWAYAMPLAERAAQPFQAVVEDPVIGPVRLSGVLRDLPDSDTLVLIVHGLAGNAHSAYCVAAARAAEQAGYASLRLSLRGADYSGEDIFHGGLTADLRAALASLQLARYSRVLLLGYSVGGHIALSAALDGVDPRLRAVTAICPPLDLDAATRAFDEPARRLYRRHIFAGLDKSYAVTAARRQVPTPPAVVKRARSCRERDALTVVPRFGFQSEADYYARASVAPRLHHLAIPSLLVASRHDPIIPARTLRPAIANASAALTVRWVERGGHVFFPAGLDLGQGGPLGLEAQVVRWLARQ